ncbi:hypothetical protein ACWEGV_36675, partial [Streptomyces sp. NPDC004976]
MLALRLSLGAHPAVQLRRLLVATASAGTGFLLLSALGHALGHPDPSAASLWSIADVRERARELDMMWWSVSPFA